MIDKMMKKGVDIENVGIMQGFMDSMADDMEDEGDDEDPEKMMERRPDSPEILMNNLRGDMRSIDARRDELADLVGYQAATETPETVLAMLQPILAKQSEGIGALPQSADMAQGPQPPMMGGAPGMPPAGMPPLPPDAGMPPPGMPPLPPDAGMGMAPPPPGQGGIAELMAGMGGGGAMPGAGMPPSDQPPIAMAQGGFVQNFQEGSDELGVRTSVEELLAENNPVQYPPDMVAAARQASINLFNQAPAALPTLQSSMGKRLPEYTKILGPNKGESEAQLLFDLGQRAFNFASNTDDSGRPLRGGFASRLAGAVKTLPAAMGKRVDEINKIDRQIKMLSLQQGEKDIDQVIAQNEKLQTRRADLMKVILREEGRLQAKKAGVKEKGPLGTGNKGDILNTLISLAPKYEQGLTSPEENNILMTAITDYTQPTTIELTDPETGLNSTRTQQNKLPDFVQKALRIRPSGGESKPPVGGAAAINTPDLNNPGLTSSNAPDPSVFQAVSTAPKSTFFDLAATGTGFVPVLVAGFARNVPLNVAGTIKPEFQQSTTMLTSMTNRVVNTLQENPRFAEGERTQILSELKLDPSLLTNKNAYINQIIALDNVIEGIEKKTQTILSTPKVGIDKRQEANKKLEEIKAMRELLGIQARTVTDPEVWKTLPPGQYVVVDPKTGFKVPRTKN